MSKVIAVTQGKGGSGKTTTCVNLACAMKEKGFNVIIADMDRDKPDALNWAKVSKDTTLSNIVIECFKDNPMNDLEELKKKYDYIFLDTPPNYQTASIKAVMLSDFVILPTSDSMLDQMALSDATSIPKMANKRYSLLANRVDKKTNASKALLTSIDKTGNAFKTFVTSRKKMVESQFEGMWIGEYEKNGDNHIQYKSLVDELLIKLNIV